MNDDYDRYRKKHIRTYLPQTDIHLVDNGHMLLPPLVFPVQPDL